MCADLSHVLMTADAVGGVWTYALELSRALASRGVRTTLATMGPLPTAAQRADAERIDGLTLQTSSFALEWMDRPWADVDAAGAWLLELEATTSPDIVHLNGFAHGALPWGAPTLIVGHSCLLSWDAALPGHIDQVKLTAYRGAATRGLRAASHVAAPSAWMLDALQHHYGPLPRTSVIANGRSPEAFGRTRKEPFIFTAGRLWDRAKNVEVVCDVAAHVPWPVMVAGDNRGAAPRGHVRYVGVLSAVDMGQWLGRAAIFALPARYEPFGLLPLEAALAHCALVLGDIPSLRDVWGDAALFVDPSDSHALRAALAWLIAHPNELAVRADAAHARALEYTPARMAGDYLALYTSLAAGPRSVACAS